MLRDPERSTNFAAPWSMLWSQRYYGHDEHKGASVVLGGPLENVKPGRRVQNEAKQRDWLSTLLDDHFSCTITHWENLVDEEITIWQ